MKVLVINAGSSSLKFRLYDMPAEQLVCAGIVERIGDENSSIHCTSIRHGEETKSDQPLPIADHAVAMREIVRLISHPPHGMLQSPDDIQLISHRVVHGGDQFAGPALITPEVLEKIKQLIPFAPMHNPISYRSIEVASAFFPKARQVAVFDTAFHHALPAEAIHYAIPKSYFRQDKIRAYGFHGISHKYVAEQARALLQRQDAKLISLHLGNGCSAAAIAGDQPMDTSMGFSPVSGLVMGTRSGDIDPSVILHLMIHHGYSVEYIDNVLNKQSGLQGLCGLSDMRDIDQAAEQGNVDAQFARTIYAYRIKKYIGAYMAVLNGLDAVIFTAGVGEHDSSMRALVCHNLSHLGIEIDPVLNGMPTTGIRAIQSGNLPVKVLVIPTNEELEIARQSMTI
ncbi:acetate/propionate family kinase [Paraflavitalea pollutisoli]|uniref:acetate/propionate family kinase n=1 Tax=Paraflavitalea pollutisoli TaxID=3034143 RepID=UPI0023EB0599|nr:acetate kinase [Paraflavitalea sp. H1-2-19X]